MDPVHTKDCDVIYKGPNEQIGDLWCHRVRRGMIRVTYEPTPEELDILKEGGRVELYIMREPIPPIRLTVIEKEKSEPVAPHGWKIPKEPGDKLTDEGENEENKELASTQVGGKT